MQPKTKCHDLDTFDPEAITEDIIAMPDRIILYATEKWGKSSFAAQDPEATFLMSKGEDGVMKLKQTGQIPAAVRHYPRPCENWAEAKRAVNALILKGPWDRTLVLDVLNGFERLLAEEICQHDFKGSWLQFNQYLAGYKACIGEWTEFIGRLDRLRQLGTTIIALAHASVEKVPNPDGPDYDRWQPAMDRKYLWPATQRWGDIILFGGFEISAEKEDPTNKRVTKGKAVGGRRRILYTEPSATMVAGNRHGLPEEIDCGESAVEAWSAFQAALSQPAE